MYFVVINSIVSKTLAPQGGVKMGIVQYARTKSQKYNSIGFSLISDGFPIYAVLY